MTYIFVVCKWHLNGDKNISKQNFFVGVEVIYIVQIRIPALQIKKLRKRGGILLHSCLAMLTLVYIWRSTSCLCGWTFSATLNLALFEAIIVVKKREPPVRRFVGLKNY